MGRKTVREQRRAEITDAFARVLARLGYAGATIAAVAEEAGFAPGLVHHHFVDKADLLHSLLEMLTTRLRRRAGKGDGDPLDAWLTSALELGETSDAIAARCWVGLLAEAVRQPALGAQVRRLVDTEIEAIRHRSGGRLSIHESSAILAFVMGSFVLGAFAPMRTSGFAAPAARTLARAFRSG